MKSRRFSRKSIVVLFALVVFFCSLQSLSFGQNAEITITPNSLSEATLGGSVVTLTLHGGLRFVQDVNRIKSGVIFPPTSGITIMEATDRTDTTVKLTLQFSGDFDGPTTLTIAVRGGILENAEQDNFPVSLNIITTVESLSATTTPTPLTEATLGESTVTLTLEGRTFEEDTQKIKDSVLFSGIGGVSAGSVERLSDTQVRIGLQYIGNSHGNSTLRILMIDEGIKHYRGSGFPVEFPVTSVTESLSATAPAPLTEATLDGSVVTLTLEGRTLEQDLTGQLATIPSSVRIATIERLNDTQVRVQLQFNGDFDNNINLTFYLQSTGIKSYNDSTLRANIPITATTESLSATTLAPLTEATLNGSVVTLTLHGRTFEETVGQFVSVSGISDVSVGTIQRLNDTQITVPLQFSGNFARNATLTFMVNEKDIKNYRCGRCTYTLNLRAEIPVTAIVEPPTTTAPTPQPPVAPTPQPTAASLTATPTFLTEATLGESRVTLTLQEAIFKNDINKIRGSVSTSGIPSVIFPADAFTRDSDTQITIRLFFKSNLDRDGTLTFRVNQWGIQTPIGSDLTAEIPVFATTESLTATPTSLTEATLHGSHVRLTLHGRKFVDNIEQYVTTSGLPGGGLILGDIDRVSDTAVIVPLEFHGILNSDATLTFGINPGGIQNYAGPNLRVEIPVSAGTAPVTAPKGGTPQGVTSQPNVAPTPQPTVVHIPDPNLRAAVQQVIGNHPITTQTMLNLKYLYPNDLGITDLTGLEHATNLIQLRLDSNSISDISPLSGLTKLTSLSLGGNSISDISPLSGLTKLTDLSFYDNNISDISPLTRLTKLTDLGIWDNNISDISPLSGLTKLTILALDSNSISDISPLSGLTKLTDLSLQHNSISDVFPLTGLTRLTDLALSGNPLSAVSINTHIPVIQARGTQVSFDNRAPTTPPTPQPPANVGTTPQPNVVSTPQPTVVSTPQPTVIRISDRNLRVAIQEVIGNQITTDTLLNLTTLEGYNLEISDLTGLEHATNLSVLSLWGNSISDVAPLAGLTQLTELDLYDNNISDISPLVGLTRLTDLSLEENPLSAVSINTHIPAIQANGTEVEFDDRIPTTPQTPPTVAPTPQLPPTASGPPSRISISGSATRTGATVNQHLDAPLLVRVLDDNGNGVADTRVIFRVIFGRGKVSELGNGQAIRVRTDQSGTARADLTPLEDGTLTVQATATEISQTVEFTITTGDASTPRTPGTPPAVGTAGSQPVIYWIDSEAGRIQHFDGSNVHDIITGLAFSQDASLDITGDKMYWTALHKIQCANLDGSNVQDLVTGLDRIWGLALDVAGGKIYWTSAKWNAIKGWDPGKIQCANLDGSNVQDLVTGLDRIWGLALDVTGGKMYWTNNKWNATKGKWDPGKIQCANLDGSNVQDLVTGLNVPWSLALDITGGKMYWTALHKIQRANLDGSNVQDITTEINVAEHIALDVTGGKMYWADPSSSNIQYANLDGSNMQDLVTGLAYPTGIALGIPPQTVVSRPTKTAQVHVEAADRPPMYWIDTAAGTLHRLVDAEVENLVPSVRNATSLTLDVANDTLYWTEKTSHTTGKIQSANLDGTNVALVKDLTSAPIDIALDATNGKLYLTNAYGKVQRMNVDGSGFQPNLITGLDTLTGLAIDVAGAKLYWTEKTGDSAGNIRSANLDGTNVQLLTDITSVPLDIALDAVDGKLYWTNARGKVQRMNVDGSGFQPNFITGLNKQMNIAVDPAGQHLYLTSSDGKISRRNFSGGSSEEVATGLGNPGALVLGDAILDDQMAVDTTPQTTAPDTMDNAFDVNNDGTVDDKDASLVSNAIKNGSTDPKYDVNGDGVVNILDHVLVLDNRDRNPYDVNADGTVDDKDASLLTDAITNGSTDAKYDVNDDGKVNFDDLQLVLDNRDRNPYDINADGTVDDKDASLLTDAITNGSTDAKYDVNDDGKVNFDDLQLVLDNRDPGAAGAPPITKNMKFTAAQMARLQEQIDLLIATGDRSPAAIRTLIYLQQWLAMARPEKTQLLANYPNPFNPETWIPYELATDTNVKITIYNTQGVVIRTLALGHQSAGYYTGRDQAAYWDGRNAFGEQVASGIYFYQFETDDLSLMRKMVILK